MEREEIEIKIVGLCNTGKSTLQKIITDHLRDKGLNVEIINNDFESEEEFQTVYGQNNEARLKSILAKNKVVRVSEHHAIKTI